MLLVAAIGIGLAQVPAAPSADAPLVGAVRAHAASTLGDRAADVEVLDVALGRPLACPDGAAIEVSTPPGEDFLGRVPVGLIGRTPSGDVCDRLRITARFRVWVDLPVVAEARAAGESIGPVRRARVDRAAVIGRPVSAEAALVARIPIESGTPLTDQTVRPAPLAAEGATVTLVAGAGPLTISATGRLLEDALPGQPVRVANLATGAVVQGTFISPGVFRAGGAL